MDGRWNKCSRRSLVLLPALWLLDRGVAPLLAKGTSSNGERAVGPLSPPDSDFRTRNYVVNATVMIGVIPIFTQSRVGGAVLAIEQESAQKNSRLALQFGAGTWPERLKGFNRFGMTRELVQTDNCEVAESSYMSFMASSRETNFSQAEQAFRSKSRTLPVTIAAGRCSPQGCTKDLVHDAVTPDRTWRNCPTLVQNFERRMAPIPTATLQRTGTSQVLPTFLYCVRSALLQNGPATETTYAHNAELYRLKTEAHHNNHSGHRILTCRTSRLDGHGASEFNLWSVPGRDADLPLRIEFRPRSFLKLTLEADETQNNPTLNHLFQEPGI